MELDSKIVVPVVSVLISGVLAGAISLYGYRQTRHLAERQGDASLLEKFTTMHFAEGRSHRITPYLIDAMSAPPLRRGLREFVFWEVTARNFKDSVAVTAFDRDHDDWATLGEVAFGLRRDWDAKVAKRSFDDWWCDKKRIILARWPQHRPRIEELYQYLDKYYFDDYPRPLKPCQSVIRK
jgi:hypothetical protein